MTQEGQALPSPTPTENPVEPITTATSNPLTEAPNHKEQDKPQDDTEGGRQQEEIRVGEGETREDEEGRAEEKHEGEEGEAAVTGGGGEREGTDVVGEGCKSIKVNSTGEEETHAAKTEKDEETESEGIQPCTEETTEPHNPERLVHCFNTPSGYLPHNL